MNDPFVLKYSSSEIKIAAEFLTTWLPFLTRDLCNNCSQSISNRVLSLDSDFSGEVESMRLKEIQCDCDSDSNSLGSWKDSANGRSDYVPEVSSSSKTLIGDSPSVRVSWADMAQEEDELERGDADEEVENNNDVRDQEDSKQISVVDQENKVHKSNFTLSRERREYLRFRNVVRKKDFICLERINGKGKFVNIVDGLELHTGVFSAPEQKRIVDFISSLQEKGRRGELKERTFSAPKKWMPGKGRETIQFGCCYNYAVLKDGHPPGILRNEQVDPIPRLFKMIIRRLIGWHVLPPTCVPDSCIVNIYERGDCIPPHIDHHDFVRPFCTVSFLSECNILFGTTLKIEGPGDFSGPMEIPLPVGSVLVLNGNGADVAKHCVPAVPSKRISITFRKMDEKKLPFGFVPEPDLQGLQPLQYDVDDSNTTTPVNYPPQGRRQVFIREDEFESGRGGFSGRGSPHYAGRTRPHPGTKPRLRVSLDM